MPTAWLPWPGKVKATDIPSRADQNNAGRSGPPNRPLSPFGEMLSSSMPEAPLHPQRRAVSRFASCGLRFALQADRDRGRSTVFHRPHEYIAVATH
jgi:hypothetical protein